MTDPGMNDAGMTDAGMHHDPAAPPAGSASPTVAENAWGRVDAEGTVYVRTADGERAVGNWQAAEPEAGLAFFVRRYADLETQVSLLEQRVGSGAVSPEDAAQTVGRLAGQVAGAQAVGDLDDLLRRLAGVRGTIEERRAQRRAERAKALDEARARKEEIAAEAERIAGGNDWRHGADRLRTLLETWKGLPRLDRASDDALWRRFSGARTSYTRARKTHFAEVGERREQARAVKEGLVAEAEELATSTEWGATAGRYRDLMARWKAVGPAPKGIDDVLWARFRAAQDRFFAARAERFAARDAGEQQALDAKSALLAEAEAMLPVTDVRAARAALRSVQERWESAGRVPRDATRGVEGRLRAVEEAVRAAERSAWQRSDPAARARAEDAVGQLRSAIADLEAVLEAARDRHDEQRAHDAEAALAARRSWLEQAERVLADLS